MDYFTPHTFQIPALTGISAKNIEEHLKLYAGYVKFANYIVAKITELSADAEKNAYEIAELQRRFAFEHDGMKNHEMYFSQFEGGPHAPTAHGAFMTQVEKDFGSWDAFMARLKAVCMTRGVGWAMLYYCKETGHLLTQWVDEQHLGHLAGPKLVLAIDMWEHSYVADYQPSGKKQYVDDFFANLNWQKVEERFA